VNILKMLGFRTTRLQAETPETPSVDLVPVEVKKPAALQIVVGASYPSMFAGDPHIVTVTSIVNFLNGTEIHFVTHTGITHSNDLDTFLRKLVHRFEYDRTTIKSVDVTEYFTKMLSEHGGRYE
jgi:hypothetical protein